MPGSGFNNRNAARPNQKAQQRISLKAKNGNWQKGWAKNSQKPTTTAKPDAEQKANQADKS